MEQNHEDLGPAEVWQIRLFPRGLRQYLADQARKEGIVVGDLLTRIVLAYRDGGGKVIDGFANTSNTSTDAIEMALDRSIERIRRLVDIGQPVPETIIARVFGLIESDLKATKSLAKRVLKPRLTQETAPPPRERVQENIGDRASHHTCPQPTLEISAGGNQ
jgi:hypothetical protein